MSTKGTATNVASTAATVLPDIRISEVGSGEAVLFLHGAPASSASFQPIADALSARYRCLIADLPGYRGVPALQDGMHPFEDVQRAVESALLERGIARVAVVGGSLGAWRALRMALTSKIEVVGIVMLGGFAGLKPAHAEQRKQLASVVRMMPTLDTPEFVTAVLGNFLGPQGQSNVEFVEHVRAWLRAPEISTLAQEFVAIAEEPRLSGLESLRIPVVARVGDADIAVPLEYSQELAATIPGCRLEIAAGKSHALNVEDLPATLASIEGLLARAWGRPG